MKPESGQILRDSYLLRMDLFMPKVKTPIIVADGRSRTVLELDLLVELKHGPYQCACVHNMYVRMYKRNTL